MMGRDSTLPPESHGGNFGHVGTRRAPGIIACG